MAVPAQAEEDVEREFAALRIRLDDHYATYEELFAGLLAAQLGPEQADAVMAGFRSESLQRYLRAAPAIEKALQRGMQDLYRRMGVALSDMNAA